jgi:hypothetical protein
MFFATKCFAHPLQARRQRVAALEKAEAQKVSVVKAAEAEAEAKFLQYVCLLCPCA